MTTFTLVDAHISNNGFDWILTVQTSFFGFFKRERQFIGNCTVWFEYPSWRGADTGTAMVLCGFWERAMYKAEVRATTKARSSG
jgi:hypothetical protein